jgi:hypothetical protein
MSLKKLSEKKMAGNKRPKYWPAALASSCHMQKKRNIGKNIIIFLYLYYVYSTFNHPSIAQLVERAALVQGTGVQFPLKELFFN